jgi:hypothetical protein
VYHSRTRGGCSVYHICPTHYIHCYWYSDWYIVSRIRYAESYRISFFDWYIRRYWDTL